METGIILYKSSDIPTNIPIGEIILNPDELSLHTYHGNRLATFPLLKPDWVDERVIVSPNVPTSLDGEPGDLWICTKESGDYAYSEFYKTNNGWVFRPMSNLNTYQKSKIFDYFEPKVNYDGYITRSGGVKLNKDAYDSVLQGDWKNIGDESIIPKEYLNQYSNFMKNENGMLLENGEMDEDYIGGDENNLVTLGTSKSIYYFPPTEEPEECGAIWNDNGTLRIQKCEGVMRYYTTEELGWRSDGITRPVTNGYIDVITNDSVYPTSNRDKVTKGEIIRYGNRSSYRLLFYYCTNMTEFVVSAEDESKITDFSWAWYNCTSLTSFPQLDVSSGTNFYGAWGYCHKLPECPLNYLNIPSGADTSRVCDYCCDE